MLVITLDGIFWGFFGFLSWGVADYLARAVSMRVGSMSTALLVQVIGLALPLPFILGQFAVGGADVDWAAFAIWAPISAGFLGMGYLSYYTGLQRGSVSVVTSAASGWLAVTVVVAVVFFGERISLAQAALMVVVLGGILLLSIQRTTKTGKSAGMVWGLGAMAGLGVSLAVLDRVTEAGGAMLAVFGARALSVIPVYAFMRSRGVGIQLPRGRGGWGLLVGAALLDAGGFVGFNLGVDVAPVAVVAPIVAAHPVVTTGLAVVMLRERPRSLQWLGAGVTVAAVVGLSAFVGA